MCEMCKKLVPNFFDNEFNTKKKNRSRTKWRQRCKSMLEINEQCCIRQNDGKLKE